jgi:hypothetical protein
LPSNFSKVKAWNGDVQDAAYATNNNFHQRAEFLAQPKFLLAYSLNTSGYFLPVTLILEK